MSPSPKSAGVSARRPFILVVAFVLSTAPLAIGQGGHGGSGGHGEPSGPGDGGAGAPGDESPGGPENPRSGPCVVETREGLGPACARGHGLYELFDENGASLGLTHGLDESVDPSTVLAGEMGPTAMAGRDPVCVPDADPYFILVVYARAFDDEDRYALRAPEIREQVRGGNQLVHEAAQATGGVADLRLHCTDGQITVQNAILPTTNGSATASSVFSDMRNVGYNDHRIKYWVFYDEKMPSCCAGVANMFADDRLVLDNLNNGAPDAGPMFAVTFDVKNKFTPLHELGHTLGAVQDSAPHSSLLSHCYDGLDTMCYMDGGRNEDRFSHGYCGNWVWDCGGDDYFSIDPDAGSYLGTQWNLGSSLNRYVHTELTPRPDLVLTSLTIDPAQPMEGSVVRASATVMNAGPGDASGFLVRFLLDDVLAGIDRSVPDGLPAGSSVVVSTGIGIPQPGDHVLQAVVNRPGWDFQSQTHYRGLRELDTMNNDYGLPFSVSRPPPDPIGSATFGSPYPSSGRAVGCDDPLEACRADAAADAESGDLRASVAMAGSPDLDADGNYGFARAWQAQTFELPEPALEFTALFRFELDAKATYADWANLEFNSGARGGLFGTVDSSACEGCTATTFRTVVGSTAANMQIGLDTDPDDVTLVDVSLTLKNPSGEPLPAGELWLRGGVLAEAWMEAAPSDCLTCTPLGTDSQAVAHLAFDLVEVQTWYTPTIKEPEVTDGPDLALTGLSLSPPNAFDGRPYLEGDTFQANVTVSNLGTMTAPAFKIWILPGDAGRMASYYYISTGLAVGESRTIFPELLAYPSGSWTARFIIEPYPNPLELDRSNNAVAVPISVAPAPDLRVAAVSVSPAAPMRGDVVTVTATVANGMSGAAAPTTVRFLLDGSALGSDQAVPGLAGLSQATFTQSWTATTGVHQVRVIVDPTQVVPESNDLNQERAASISVGSQADLTVPGLVIYGDGSATHRISATLRNSGTIDAKSFAVRFLADDVPIGADESVTRLGANAYAIVDHSWTPTTSGWHTVRVIADPFDSVPEENESNNEASKAVSITLPSPTHGVDLSPESQSMTIKSKATATYSVVVTNTGTARDTIQLTKSAASGGWKVSLSASSVTVDAGASVTVTLKVTAPAGKNASSPFVVTVTGTSVADAAAKDTSKATSSIG